MQYFNATGRVAELEDIITKMAAKMDGMGDDVVKKLNAQAAKRQRELKSELANVNGGSEGKPNLLAVLRELRMLGGGSSSMDKFFWQLGQRAFFEGIAWQETFMNEQAKGMGREFVKDWKERQNRIKKEFEQAKAGGKKE